jgi:NMD protein affecting ribosome stability and mRNA decay
MAAYTMTLKRLCAACGVEHLILWMSGGLTVAVCPKCDVVASPPEGE